MSSHSGHVMSQRQECGKKVQYSSKKDAEQGIKKFNRVNDWNGKDREYLSAYICRWCGYWHIGHDRQIENKIFLKKSKEKFNPADYLED